MLWYLFDQLWIHMAVNTQQESNAIDWLRWNFQQRIFKKFCLPYQNFRNLAWENIHYFLRPHVFGDVTITVKGYKFWIILGTHGHWAVMVLKRASPTSQSFIMVISEDSRYSHHAVLILLHKDFLFFFFKKSLILLYC